MEMFERPIAGAVINMVDYPAHARRRYGDAIHHITNLTEYYDQDDVGGGLTWVDRMRRKWRRSRRNLAENLHFNCSWDSRSIPGRCIFISTAVLEKIFGITGTNVRSRKR